MALRSPLTPVAYSSDFYTHAGILETFLRSSELATAPDVNDLFQNEQGDVINLGWVRHLARDLRRVANYLDSQEPKAAVAADPESFRDAAAPGTRVGNPY